VGSTTVLEPWDEGVGGETSSCWGNGIVLVAELGNGMVVWVSPISSSLLRSSLIGTLRVICLLPEFDRYSKLIENIEPPFRLMYSHNLVLAAKTTIVLISAANTSQQIVRNKRGKSGDGTMVKLLETLSDLCSSSLLLVGSPRHPFLFLSSFSLSRVSLEPSFA